MHREFLRVSFPVIVCEFSLYFSIAGAAYPYQEYVKHDGLFPCRYNKSTSVGTTTGYGRIRPMDEVTLKNVVAAVGPVSFLFNAVLDTFLYYRLNIMINFEIFLFLNAI